MAGVVVVVVDITVLRCTLEKFHRMEDTTTTNVLNGALKYACCTVYQVNGYFIELMLFGSHIKLNILASLTRKVHYALTANYIHILTNKM